MILEYIYSISYRVGDNPAYCMINDEYWYHYDFIKLRCLIYKEELFQNWFHPRNLNKFRDWKIDGLY